MKKVILFLLLAQGCRSAPTLTGTWSGVFDGPHKPGVGFALEDSDGTITGRVFWEDPVTFRFEPEGELVGVRDGATVSWTSQSEVRVVGTVVGDSFEGTLTFPIDEEDPGSPHSARLTLSRQERAFGESR